MEEHPAVSEVDAIGIVAGVGHRDVRRGDPASDPEVTGEEPVDGELDIHETTVIAADAEIDVLELAAHDELSSHGVFDEHPDGRHRGDDVGSGRVVLDNRIRRDFADQVGITLDPDREIEGGDTNRQDGWP